MVGNHPEPGRERLPRVRRLLPRDRQREVSSPRQVGRAGHADGPAERCVQARRKGAELPERALYEPSAATVRPLRHRGPVHGLQLLHLRRPGDAHRPLVLGRPRQDQDRPRRLGGVSRTPHPRRCHPVEEAAWDRGHKLRYRPRQVAASQDRCVYEAGLPVDRAVRVLRPGIGVRQRRLPARPGRLPRPLPRCPPLHRGDVDDLAGAQHVADRDRAGRAAGASGPHRRNGRGSHVRGPAGQGPRVEGRAVRNHQREPGRLGRAPATCPRPPKGL